MLHSENSKPRSRFFSRKASFLRLVGKSSRVFPPEWENKHFATQARSLLYKNSSSVGNNDQARVVAGFDTVEDELTFRRRLQRWLVYSSWGYRLELFNCLLSLLACLLYVWETYESSQYSRGFGIIELIFSTFFIADYFLQLYLSDNRLRHVVKTEAMIDLLTITPVFLTALETDIMFMRVLRVIRVVRVLRIMRVNRFIMSSIDSEVSQEIASVGLTVVSAAFFGAGIIHQVDNFYREQNWLPLLQFHDALYFVVVTISTVGFGDINPESDVSKLIVMLLIIAGLVYIPKSTNNLVQLMSNDSVYARRKYKPNRHCQHIVVCGHIHVGSVEALLCELFHEDHGNMELHVVVLVEDEPDASLLNLLKSQRYSLNVTLLRGCVFVEKDLQRAAVSSSAAIFVLTDQLSDASDKQDATTILCAMSVKRYVHGNSGRDVMTCVQILRPENKFHFGKYFSQLLETPAHQDSVGSKSTLTLDNDLTGDEFVHKKLVKKLNPVICIDEIKMNLLAQSCLCPGVVTMIANLVNSVDTKSFDSPSLKRRMPKWAGEYQEGCEFEIYRTKLSPLFTDLPFNLAAMLVYKFLGVCMFALEVELATNKGHTLSEVIVNPGQLKIPDVHRFTVHGFVIAKDKSSSELSTVGYTAIGEGNSGTQNFHRNTVLVESYDELARTLTHLHVNVNGSSAADVSMRSSKRDSLSRSEREEEEFEDTAQNSIRKILTAPPGDVKSPKLSEQDMKRPSFKELMKAKSSFVIHEDRPACEIDQANSNQTNEDDYDDETLDQALRSLYGGSLEQAQDQSQSIPSLGLQRTLKRASTLDPQLKADPVSANKFGNIRLLSKIRGGALKKLIKSDLNNLDRQNYYTLEQPKTLRESTIETSFMEEFPSTTGHIVITGSIHNVSYLIRTLRARYLGQAKVIVILHEEPPTHRVWSKLSHYPAVYYMEGSSLSQDDLYRAGISVASCAVVLANRQSSRFSSDMQVDATSIFAHQGMVEMNPQINIITEIIAHGNIEFLDLGVSLPSKPSSHASGKINAHITESSNYTNTFQFITGKVFSSSVLDTLLAQSFFNPHISTILRKLVAGNGTNLLLNRETLQKGYNDEAQEMLRSMRDSNIFQIPVPKEYIGVRYGKLFVDFCGNKAILPLGLRRIGDTRKGHGLMKPQNSTIGYTVTNPPKNLTLRATDRVFILSQDVPSTSLAGITGNEFFSHFAGGLGADRKLPTSNKERGVDQSDIYKILDEIHTLQQNVKYMQGCSSATL